MDLANVKAAAPPVPPAEDVDDMDVFACGYQEDQPVNPDDAALDEVKLFSEIIHGRNRCRWKPKTMANMVFCKKNGKVMRIDSWS